MPHGLQSGDGWRRIAKIGCLALLATVSAARIGSAEKPAGEYELKAAFLYTFAQFTEWPAEVFPGPGAPLIIGIVGDDPFGRILDDTIKEESIHGRPTVIRRIERGEDLKSCHLIFVSSSERRQLPQILAEIKGGSVLTMSEIDRFGYFGGIVTLTMEGPRVRFEINLNAAEQARLKISSKLLKLAKITGASR
jgi:YfiR/HmsC-like